MRLDGAGKTEYHGYGGSGGIYPGIGDALKSSQRAKGPLEDKPQ